MKRYLLFVFDTYYPAGGYGDLDGDFDSPEDALAHLKGGYEVDFAHLLDTKTGDWCESQSNGVFDRMNDDGTLKPVNYSPWEKIN